MKKTITIFTPVYNRANILSVLYQSLIRQTNKNFLWMIVDDGSQDNIAELVDTWVQEKIVDIRFYHQKNGGKHRAHNRGVSMCDTEWFICVDSDDYLTDNAVDIFIKEIGLTEKNEIGIIFPKYEVHLGFPKLWFSCGEKVHISDMRLKLRKNVESALLFKTDFLKDCLFPEFENEKFLGEEIIYNELDKMGKMRASDAKVYCFEYREDGLTKNAFLHWKNNPIGMLALLRSRYCTIKHSDAKKTRKYILIFQCIMNINALCFITGKRLKDNSPNMFLSATLFFPAKIFAHYRYGSVK